MAIAIDYSRDKLLTHFGLATLMDRYVMKGERPQDLFGRVAQQYAENEEHGNRIYDYMSKLWFMPATPVLSNGGTDRGLPISCFLNEVADNIPGIQQIYSENISLASSGGGIGTYWGNVRSIGESIKDRGTSCGIVPFIKVMDSLTLAISQGSVRRGSAAIYLRCDHPEIEDMVNIRVPTGGDPNRKALNLHHGVVITDDFMRAVEKGAMWDLISPATGVKMSSVDARTLWAEILTTRIETGEPYILFIDAVNRAIPKHHKKAGLHVKTSNLCSEITLPTAVDRTAVCCLSSLNLEYYEEWKDNKDFIQDIMLFLDNVLSDFIEKAPESIARAKYSAMRERSVGLGVMGFHSFLQSKMVPFESAIASSWNRKMFEHIKIECDKASVEIAKQKGACPDAADFGIMERFSNKTAVAPTASISIICGESSPGIEPYSANYFVQKTLSGSHSIRNKHLGKVLAKYNKNTDDIWSSIAVSGGSVMHLDFLDQHEKDVFKTAFELNQAWVIEHAAVRTPFICQAQSVNVFLPSNASKKEIHDIHFQAWKKGLKSLYYCRSASIQRPDNMFKGATLNPIIFESTIETEETKPVVKNNEASIPSAPSFLGEDECLSCQ
jgi:ribonucleoside-diphosphate reductase alpha chain